MEWFIPHASSKESALKAYEAMKKHVAKVVGVRFFSERRVRKIAFSHNAKYITAEVGKVMRMREISEEVFAILYEPDRSLYHVCTPSRGVLRNMSVLVGADEVSLVEDFDPE